tara:strand:- start:68 stop:535 length:468 start_codon:yes stop_codon:yes gene_type:complete
MEITDYPNYLIYDDGRVQNKKTKRFLKQSLDNKGYYRVNLYKNNNRKLFKIHRLVALHYLDNVEGKNVIDHIDRNKTNNHISNLRWCNHSENRSNTDVHKSNVLGEKHISKTKNDTYIFRIENKNEYHTKTFKTLDECIKYRDDYISTHYPHLHL